MSEYTYSGWAPCVHKAEEKAKFKPWVQSIVPEILWLAFIEKRYEEHHGGLLESLIWRLGSEEIELIFHIGQWTATLATGTIKDQNMTTRIKADSLLLGVIETYRWWNEKCKELTGKALED